MDTETDIKTDVNGTATIDAKAETTVETATDTSAPKVETKTETPVETKIEAPVETTTEAKIEATVEVAPAESGFAPFNLPEPIMKALDVLKYEKPTPIQERTIVPLLEGRDVLGQAQTGTGKTAAFALPLLARLDFDVTAPQVLVLAPTRELAIQVAKAFKDYARYMKGFRVQAIYGGQDYEPQLRGLRRGPQVVVGTPGRVMDHIRRGTLKLDSLSAMVLDEADEMLHMGFLEDVQWVLEQAPDNRQLALFSATMPEAIRRVANDHLTDPEQVLMKVRTTVAETITQSFWLGNWRDKLDILLRLLEGEPYESMILFTKTKISAVELSEELKKRGYACAFLNGDLPQRQREAIVKKLKDGDIDLLVATDVAARGLDIRRLSHVINFDAPHNVEAYIHRIGRVGRAGREGKAMLFLSPRDRYLLRDIERATKTKMSPLELPSIDLINEKRVNDLIGKITKTLKKDDLDVYTKLLEKYMEENTDVEPLKVAAALASLLQGDEPFLLTEQKARRQRERNKNVKFEPKMERRKGRDRPKRGDTAVEEGMERFRLAVGRNHGVKVGNIVGAIANEAGLESKYIGRINIFGDYSTVDLPEGMPNNVFQALKNAWVSGKQLRIAKFVPGAIQDAGGAHKKRKHPKKNFNRSRKTVKSKASV